MTTQMPISSQQWKSALESTDPQQLYTVFSSIVDATAQKLKQQDLAIVRILGEVYQKTMEATPSSTGSTFQQTAVGSSKDMVEGLKMATEGYFEFDAKKVPKSASFNEQVAVINGKFSQGDVTGAMQAFKLFCGLVLRNKLSIDRFADMTLESPSINQRLCNWSSALGMLYRAKETE